MTKKYEEICIYTDGASRGNPGNSSASFVVVDADGQIVKHDSKFLGKTTNNRAEYRAVIFSLKEASNLTSGKVTVYSDSKLLVKQLTGFWRVKNDQLKELFDKVKKLTKRFQSVDFKHVNRENKYVSIADKLCNEKLDSI